VKRERSDAIWKRAIEVIPGGVNSPVRAFRAVGGDPVFIARGKGARVWDVDGNEYVDYLGSWGALLWGHAHETIVAAVEKAARDGSTFGAATEAEVEIAELVRELVPSCERLRMVSSGTEATMSALRVARGFTGRDKVIKIDGGYHGHADPFLAAAGSGVATFGLPDSAGVPAGAVKDTLIVPWNDVAAVGAALDANHGQVAALIVEPVQGNAGTIPPAEGYLARLRELCTKEGVVLIFDEVMTGFRVARGGAQALYGVRPDLTTLGKIVGGGLPAAVFGGRAEIMAKIAPVGPVYQAGTLSGNPLAVAAGRAALGMLKQPGLYEQLEEVSARVGDGLVAAARAAGLPVVANRVGSMMTMFFTSEPVTDYASAKKSDTARYGRFFRGMLERGVYLAPSQFEAAFVSLVHGEADIARTLEAAAQAAREAG
jgi:glutamate-1-semialdehyde 2,1-aminomutase